MKKRIFSTLVSFIIIFCVIGMTPSFAVGNYGVNLGSAAYQSNLNPFYASGYGGRASDGYDGECTWYAWGRAYEKLGVALPCRGNANSWTTEAANAGYSTGTTARANSIMVEHYSGTGHVFFVENVANGYAYVTEGNWKGYYHEDAINLSTMRRDSWQSHAMGSVDYIYLGPTNNPPKGSLDLCTGGIGTVRVAGWAIDDDNPSAQIEVHVYVGGPAGSSGAEGYPFKANMPRNDVGNHSYDYTFNTNKTGRQDVYVYAIDSGGGSNKELGHVTINIGNPNPIGVIDSVTDNQGSVKVSGWAFDPSDTSKSITVHVYVGGPAGSGARCYPITANTERVDVDNAYHCGKYHGFGAVVPTDLTGSQSVYIYGINVGNGWENPCFGYRTVNITKHTHNLVRTPAKAATTSAEGNIEYWTCSGCGKLFSDAAGRTEITKAQTVIPKLTQSVTSEPAPTLSINAKISKPKAAKKAVTVKWKKISKKNQKKISGVQIQVASDPGFNSIVKTATAGKKKTSKKIKGLAKKTTYYVRVRTYKGGEIGTWSGPKKFKTK